MSFAARARWLVTEPLRRARAAPLETSMLLGALLVTLYVIGYPLLIARYPPLTDLPFHATGISILRHYPDPAWHFKEQFSLEFLKVPYWTLYGLGAFFALFVPVVTATKLATIVCLAAVPGGLAVLFHGMKKSPYLGLFGLFLVWNTLTHWGFINFVAAIGLFAATIGLALLVVDAPTRGRRVWLAVTLVMVFATHVFRYPYAVAAVLGTGLVLYPSTGRFRPLLLPLAPSLALFALWLLVRDKGGLGQGGFKLALHWERLAELKGHLFGGFVGPEERGLAARAALILGCVALTCLAFFGFQRRFRDWTRRDWLFHGGAHLAVLCCVAACLVGYFTLPMDLGVWWCIYPREGVAACILALALVPDLPRRAALRWPLLGAVAFATMSQALFVAESFDQFEKDNAGFAELVEALPQAPRLGYMIYDHRGANLTRSPFVHMPAWVQAEKGGWLSFHFFAWNASPIRFRPYDPRSRDVPPPTPAHFEWAPRRFDVATRGKFFDWFLVRAPVSPDELFEVDPTIRLLARRGDWWLYRRVGAP